MIAAVMDGWLTYLLGVAGMTDWRALGWRWRKHGEEEDRWRYIALVHTACMIHFMYQEQSHVALACLSLWDLPMCHCRYGEGYWHALERGAAATATEAEAFLAFFCRQ